MAPPTSVVVHPLVLLSTVDHYSRVAKDTKKRVVGVLLGESSKGNLDVTNSFAVPFDEDDRNPAIWYLDHDFLETMSTMFKKVAGTFDLCNRPFCVSLIPRFDSEGKDHRMVLHRTTHQTCRFRDS
jgi:hypothetical protein